MNRYHFLTEAEIDAKKNELLSQLSDEDLAMIVGELSEAEGGRFAFDPLKRQPAAQRQPVQQQPNPAPKPQAQPKPQAKQEPKPQPKKVEPARKAEIKQTVDQLKPKEKAALVKAAKAELKKREASPKEVKPAQPGTLKKVVKNLALVAVAATVIGGMFGGGDKPTTGADQQVQQTVQQDFLSRPGDKGQYKIIDKKTDANNPNVTVLLTQRKNTDGTITYSVRGIDVTKNKEYPVVGTNSADDADGLVKMRNIFSNPKLDKGVDIVRGSIPSMYRDALRDPNEVKAEKEKLEKEKNTASYLLSRNETEIKSSLRDPDSLKDLTQMAVYMDGEKGPVIVVVGMFNAKNAFGAYTGRTLFINGGGTIVTDPETVAHLWKKIDKNGDGLPDQILAR